MLACPWLLTRAWTKHRRAVPSETVADLDRRLRAVFSDWAHPLHELHAFFPGSEQWPQTSLDNDTVTQFHKYVRRELSGRMYREQFADFITHRRSTMHFIGLTCALCGRTCCRCGPASDASLCSETRRSGCTYLARATWGHGMMTMLPTVR